mgnify:CR=1 FL=1
MRGDGRGALVRRLAAMGLALGALAVSGCAAMPDSGQVRRVGSPQRAEAESATRVFGVSPERGAQPPQIVWGFLEATTSDEAQFATARKYLTAEAARSWDPFARTTVLASGPEVSRQRSPADREDYGYTVLVTGTRVAEVDGGRGYTPSDGTHEAAFHLSMVDGEWRIDSLPDGLILSEADFRRIYRSVDLYYYAEYGPEANGVPGGSDVLIAEPIYIRRRIDPVTDVVRALVAGPSRWLDPVAESAFPGGTRLAPDQRLSLDDSGVLTVRLTGAGTVRADQARCGRMAIQVLHTVQDQASAKVSEVELTGPDGQRLCSRTREEAAAAAPGRLDGRATRRYFIDGEHRLVAVEEKATEAEPVDGPLGSGKVPLSAAAVSRDELLGAGLNAAGNELYVSPLSIGTELRDPVLVSAGSGENGLTAPSWDGLGDLWVADRDPDRPRLLRLPGGTGEPEPVAVPDLGKDERITALKVASDGARIALLVERDGHTSLRLGRIERRGTAAHPWVTVASLRAVAPHRGESPGEVVAFSWAGVSRLVVAVRQPGGVQQLQYLETDGSVLDIPLPGIPDVVGIAASEDDRKPLLANSGEGIVSLPLDGNLHLLAEKGRAPVYPG